jgi:hypothetical protein
MAELFVLVIGMGLGIKLIANVAEPRGRSPMLWGLIGGVAYLVAYALVNILVELLRTPEDDNAALVMLALFAPFMIAGLAMAGVGAIVARLGVKVVQRREYDVHCRHNGAGRLEITPEVVRLHWEGRSEEIARSQLQAVAVDGECLRLRWTEGELLLLPMGRPQSREGRIGQSQALARILSPGLPVAIRVDRNASKTG